MESPNRPVQHGGRFVASIRRHDEVLLSSEPTETAMEAYSELQAKGNKAAFDLYVRERADSTVEL